MNPRATLPLLLSAALLVSTAQAEAQTRRPAARPPQRPNVLLITVDTLRADHLGAYGSTEVSTPSIDALARDGILFEHAFSQVPLTWPSHVAILTGTYPFHNGVQDFTGQPLGPEFRSIAQSLKANGYATGAVVSSFVLDRSWGLARGFDFYYDRFEGRAFLEKDVALVDRRAAESVDAALAWLTKRPRRPFFLWLHLYDPHSPYDPPEPFRSQYRNRLYDGEVAYTDSQLGRLLAWMKRHAIYEKTLIILLSDHGESLGEHGEAEHGFFVYSATTRVPLVVKPPAGMRVRARRVGRAVETIAVAPTILEVARLHDRIEKQVQAASLFSEASEEESAAYSETFYPFSSFGWSPLRSLETRRYRYVEAPAPELYDLEADPEEKNNLAGRQSAVQTVLKEKLMERVRRYAPPQRKEAAGNLTPETIEKLRDLGYVAYRSPVSAEQLAAGLPDPKSKLWEFNSILKATDALAARDVANARRLLLAVQEKDPKMYLVPFLLGQGASREGNWKLAEEEFQKSLELNPNFDQAMTGLARALHLEGRTSEAKTWIEKALQFNPQNVRAWYELGWMEMQRNPAAAVSALEKTLSLQPNFALAHRDLGMLRLEEKNYAAAGQHLQAALELGLGDAPLYNFLGIAYSNSGKLQRAVTSYRKALEADPNLAEAHLNLAFAYQKLQQLPAARREYETACRLELKFCEYVPKAKP